MAILIALVAIPLIEIAVLIKVGAWIGFWPTLGVVVATFIVGSMVVGRSGLASAIKVQDALKQGEAPVAAMLDGALIAFAGILLMTPGLVADTFGLLLLIGPLRRLLAGFAVRNIVVSGVVVGGQDGGRQPFGEAEQASRAEAGDRAGSAGGGPVIDGEFERIDERPVDGRDSGRDRGEPGDRA